MMDIKESLKLAKYDDSPLSEKQLQKKFNKVFKDKKIEIDSQDLESQLFSLKFNTLQSDIFCEMVYDAKVELYSKQAYVIFNIEDQSIQFSLKRGFFKKRKIYRDYKYKEIKSFELVANSIVEVKNEKKFGKTLAGGLLFGPIGAIAGSMATSTNERYKGNDEYVLKLTLDDFSLPYVEFKCKDRENAYLLYNTFIMWEEKIHEATKLNSTV